MVINDSRAEPVKAFYMFPTSLVFSFLTILLSAAALTPASDDPNSIQHVNRDLTLLLPPNLSNITHPPSPLNTTNAIHPRCFAPSPALPVIRPTDCHTAVYGLLVAPNTMLLRRWDRHTTLPVEQTFKTCSVILARASAGSEDVFQPALVAYAAALLVHSCVTQKWGYVGGTTRIGVREEFVVHVSASEAGDAVAMESATA
ncbi:MAG: hypothetical protein ASARMPREDX12_003525 [Alectoria sarmentosa]|nr:MAG: hypothetical protein ASARMPREDX12_003525 [Alectoria sarmentosa]